jgi:hypothetical protein
LAGPHHELVSTRDDEVGIVELLGRRAVHRVIAAKLAQVRDFRRSPHDNGVHLNYVELSPQLFQEVDSGSTVRFT